MSSTIQISTLGIRHTPQEWVNDNAADLGSGQTYDLTALATTDPDARELFERLTGGENVNDFEYDVREVLGRHFGLDHDGPFYVRPVLDGATCGAELDDERIEAVQLWLKEHPLSISDTASDSTAESLSAGLRRVSARELLNDYQENQNLPYAIVSQATGGYAVVEGEIYESSDSEFITIEVELGVLRLPLDEEADPITVAESRSAAVRLER